MLKALELVGFKSFADKTRFEFPAGITVIVGPNGSGKSNVVDAIKWVLGEQSAKSLRGKDMADVIFKGAGSGSRKPMNTAEATIVLDNSDGRFSLDAPEVHVTRRVYRSGEGEYLINRQPCRLKDIRDMFRGTGADAYSLIEQGKVDRLLQSSAKERRAIFEEAAGISRYKAKKIETQRRLGRLDQNVLRLSDIMETVESRLRSVRSQAGKAKRYREYTERLQQLRTHVGHADWRSLTSELEAVEAALSELTNKREDAAKEIDSCESQVGELEANVEQVADEIRQSEGQYSRTSEKIVGAESAVVQQSLQREESRSELADLRRELAELHERIGEVQQRAQAVSEEREAAETQHAEIAARVAQFEAALKELSHQTDELRGQAEERRGEYSEAMRESADLSSQVGGLQSTAEATEAAIARYEQRLEQLAPQRSELQSRLNSSSQREQELATVAEELGGKAEEARKELVEQRRLIGRRQDELVELQGKLSGVRQRAEVLEELERNQAGLSEGTKAALREFVGTDGNQLAHGLVADIFQADVEYASMVDVALGEWSQRLVIDDELLQHLRSGQVELESRAGFVRIDQPLPRRESDWIRLDGLTGVIGRADKLVRYDERFEQVVRRLLGNVWFTESVDASFRLQQHGARGVRFVTRNGELVEDGVLVIGPRHQTAGLVSRRAELRSLQEQLQGLERRITQSSSEVAALRVNIDEKDRTAGLLEQDHQQAVAKLAEHRVEARSIEEAFAQIDSQNQSIHNDIEASQKLLQESSEKLTVTQTAATELIDRCRELEGQMANVEGQLQETEHERQEQLRELTAAKIELAKSEQLVAGLRIHFEQFQEAQRERHQAIASHKQRIAQAHNRIQTLELETLNLTGELAEWCLAKEALVTAVQTLIAQRDDQQKERTRVGNRIQTLRRKHRKIEEEAHQKEIEATETRHRRETMAQRLRDDYGIDIENLNDQDAEEALAERERVETEIEDLRRKIQGIGAVNMEALDELDSLEAEYEEYRSKVHDLTSSKETLERIMHRIDGDSRRVFTETLETIRTNFQQLYRKAFGGGNANIILEEGVDVLEAGIEIVANPPGKPSFNNSLLSGGEKALTAVALLLAIFQFRPSPFCVLDEVDAPFDEANIDRFVNVLSEFLGWTKFVIVTHSKKTMTAATTLYGVTMQESGVSKQVSVKFEDVTEDGHIRPDAIDRDDDDQAA